MITVLRNMAAEDIPALAAIERSCFSDPWSEAMAADLIESPWDEVWVLEKEADPMKPETGAMIGYINYRFIAGEGELMRIAILPEHRGHGYSRKLMDVMMDHAAKNQITALTLEVRAGNTSAIGLYEAYGFKKEAIRKNYYHNPTEDALIMWLHEVPSIPT